MDLALPVVLEAQAVAVLQPLVGVMMVAEVTTHQEPQVVQGDLGAPVGMSLVMAVMAAVVVQVATVTRRLVDLNGEQTPVTVAPVETTG